MIDGKLKGRRERIGIASVLAETMDSAQAHNSEKLRVAIAELDSGVGFLRYLAEEANAAQSYFHFDIAYLPIPSGTMLNLAEGVQGGPPSLFLPRIDGFLRPLPKQLKVDVVCILTRGMIGGFKPDGTLFGDYLAAALTNEPRVSVVSTYKLRDYARQAHVPLLKAVLFLCVGMLLVVHPDLDFHDEAVACPLDSCIPNRDELVLGLRRMKFDHQPCREKTMKIDAGAMVGAVDALLALSLQDRPTNRGLTSGSRQ